LLTKFSRLATSSRHNYTMIIHRSPEIHYQLIHYGMSSLHFYVRINLTSFPLGCTLHTRNVLPTFSAISMSDIG